MALVILVIFVAAGPLPARAAENASTPGEIQQEPSTLHCLAVRWPVKGDDNANATIAVQYHKAGSSLPM